MTRRQRFGLGLIIASFVIWGCILLLPLTALSAAKQLMWGGVIYGISYAVFFLGVALLGKELWAKVKDRARRMVRRRPGSQPPDS